ncbi:tetratricopeptide repeat protein 33 [Galendromus occidentalis]|uniref:Tetratricopeptide repeat protein 33 n=1 Tax=Galendromus occidentalis TaxID=34638 RepID=A0AAJ6QVP4_9ACAR|nr:tetratricopeptide repeat protein 33 [Galendromus occidentalis]
MRVGVRTRRPGRIEFPSITDNEFFDLVDQIKNACADGRWKLVFELLELLCARRCNEEAMEMKAQVQLQLGENFEAVKNCERAIKINPLWWEGHRTHGRCLLAFGEIELAVKAFERAIRINPADESLREEFRIALEDPRENNETIRTGKPFWS